MKFRKRPVIVEAEQFISGIPALSSMMQESPQHTGQMFLDWPILVDQQGPYLLIHCRDGKQRVNPMDWVIRDGDSICVKKDAEFKAAYENA